MAEGTKFYVFEAEVEDGVPDLTRWALVRTVVANDRGQAIRKVYGRTPPVAVAVSESAWKPMRPRVRPVVTGLETIEMPVALGHLGGDAVEELAEVGA